MQKEWRIAPEKRCCIVEKWPFILQFEVSAVLAHMELVKSIRKRIQDALSATRIVHTVRDPKAAADMLSKALKGEVSFHWKNPDFLMKDPDFLLKTMMILLFIK